MGKLIKAELFKLSRTFTYKALITFSTVIGIAFGTVVVRGGFTAAGIFWVAIMGTGFLYNAALISLFAADYIAGEFANRTFAAEIACGASREALFGAKAAVFFVGLLPLLFIYDIITIAVLTVQNGFGAAWNADTAVFIISRVLFSILCNFTMGACILLAAYLARSRLATVGIGAGGAYLLHQCCINEHNPVLLKLWQFTFVYQMDAVCSGRRAEPVPFTIVALSSLVGTAALLGAALLAFCRCDLK